MTSNLTRACRRSARAAAVVFVTSALLAAAPALAEDPEGWSGSAPTHVAPLHLLMVLVGFPLIVFAILFGLVVVPGLARGEKLGHSNEHAQEPTWLGGPRPTHELESADSAGETGGASGSW